MEPFGLAHELNIDAEGIEMASSSTDAALPVEELELTTPSDSCLKREGIHSAGALVVRSEADLLDVRDLGQSRSTRSRGNWPAWA
ncbi:hypothetical protein GCM10009864_82320 [Streptomyces lunalinharesii]|uniref:RNA polymerase alpha subunit C-terminal domain-containing protein n=1 Tax=Streptomyces lunalinharesii TaxID=333384 RepID=A0ABN3T7E1_9ACTN